MALPAHAQTGGYPGGGGSGGSWRIDVAYLGTAAHSPTVDLCTGIGNNLNNSFEPNNGGYPLTGLWPMPVANTPAYTYSGGATAILNVVNSYQATWGDFSSLSESDNTAELWFILTWQPGPFNEPAPRTVKILCKRTITQSLSYGAIDPSVSGSMETKGSIDDLGSTPDTLDIVGGSNGDSDNAGTAADVKFTQETLPVTGGLAQREFLFGWYIGMATTGPNDSNYHASEPNAQANLRVDFCVQGFDTSRFGRGMRRFSGGHTNAATDPAFTRWLPLAFSPQIDSAPFRYQTGALPPPWGNINCAYSMAVRQEPPVSDDGLPNPNFDLDGAYLQLYPSPDAAGDYNNPRGPYRVIPDSDPDLILPAYSITDASGSRLVFDQAYTPFSDIHSTYSSGSGQLTNAGPPGDLKERGLFTYTFQPLSGSPGMGCLSSINDLFGNAQTLTYGGYPYLTVSDSSSGRSLRFYLGANGYIGSVDSVGPNGEIYNHAVLTMDGTGHLTQDAVYPYGSNTATHTDSWSYGGPNGDSVTGATEGIVSSSFTYGSDVLAPDPFKNPVPRMTSASYGASGDNSSSDGSGPVQGTYNFTYGPLQSGYDAWGIAARTNTMTDARGNVTSQLFTLKNDISGLITAIQTTGPDYAGAPANSNISTVNYNPDIAKPSAITYTDPLGHVWGENLDANGNTTEVSDPNNAQWSLGWGGSNGVLLTSVSDPTSQQWKFNYGENGNPATALTSVLDPAGVTQATINYNSFGQPINSTVPAGTAASGTNEETQISYDPVTGDVTGLTSPLGDQATIDAYDPLGDPLSSTVYPDTGNPQTSTTPLRTTVTYDAAQMPTQITTPDGTSLVPSYNNSVTTGYQLNAPGGAAQATLSLSKDTRGRVYAASDGIGSLEQMRYDPDSDLTQIWDGSGYQTHIAYGKNGEPTGLTWPDGVNQTSLTYDQAGRIASATDERGVLEQFSIDPGGRLTDVRLPNYPSDNIHFTSDPAGRPLTVTDSTGGTTISYDSLKRVSTVQTTLGGMNFTVSYTYYPDGSRKTMTSPAGTTYYTYDQAGRLQTLTDPFGAVSRWSYDHAGRITGHTTTTLAAVQLAEDFTYGVSGQAGDPSTTPSYLRTIWQYIGNSNVATYTLTHSYLHQLLSQTGSQSNGNTESDSYVYDGRGRLTSDSEQYTVDPQHIYQNSGGFDYDLSNNLNAQSGWGYNSDDQVTSAISGLGGLPAATGLGYDASGNLTSLNGSTLSYDPFGELSSDGAVSYTYDFSGRRVSKTVNGTTTYYFYDGDLLIAELNSAGQIQTAYTWGAQGLISDRVNMTGAAQSRYYFFDATGSARNLVDDGGNTVGGASYTAWGSVYYGVPNTPMAWQGRWGIYTDSETGLCLCGARYYAPDLGRFISRDPSGFDFGPNVYAYCDDDPINFFDATGCHGSSSLLAAVSRSSPQRPGHHALRVISRRAWNRARDTRRIFALPIALDPEAGGDQPAIEDVEGALDDQSQRRSRKGAGEQDVGAIQRQPLHNPFAIPAGANKRGNSRGPNIDHGGGFNAGQDGTRGEGKLDQSQARSRRKAQRRGGFPQRGRDVEKS